jgi:hypothetical protein
VDHSGYVLFTTLQAWDVVQGDFKKIYNYIYSKCLMKTFDINNDKAQTRIEIHLPPEYYPKDFCIS